MKVLIHFETDLETDGVEQSITLERSNIDLVTDLLDFYADAAKAAGFTYVDRMGYATDKGSETWSKF